MTPPTPWKTAVITLMPEMYPGPLAHSIIGDAYENGVWQLSLIHLRDFGVGSHQKVDDSPYGGGAGMVIMPHVADAAMTVAKEQMPEAQLVHLSPRGQVLNQPMLQELIARPLILFCGRYEAVDERVLEKHRPREISLGDFILTGGDVAAMAILEACVRLLPGVVGKEESLAEESFGDGDYAHLLEYPHYTKPAIWEGHAVPEVLTSGHHANVATWRREQAEYITRTKRPDLWSRYLAKKSAKNA